MFSKLTGLTNMNTTTVTIYTDDDGFYGSASADEIATFDHTASDEKYQTLVNKEIHKTYSSVEITHEWQAHLTGVTVDNEDLVETENMIETIQNIVGDVYSDGKFWTTKRQAAAVTLGKLGGAARSERKSAAAAANGRKGGRPRKS